MGRMINTVLIDVFVFDGLEPGDATRMAVRLEVSNEAEDTRRLA